MTTFIQVDIDCTTEISEILIAELSEINYDSFWEKEEGGFTAYIDQNLFDESQLKFLLNNYRESNQKEITFLVSQLEHKNWNQEWERNFEPILITDKCYVRATFHQPRTDVELEIIIDPKMSFGTGHHATTSMMIQHLLKNNLTEKSVMDVGCGTGILSIAAYKLGAKSVIGFDIEDWTVENAIENKALNGIEDIQFLESTIQDLTIIGEKFDFILANINRNVLLDEIKTYKNYLMPNGRLIISGFYTEDIEIIDDEARKNGLEMTEKMVENNWSSINYKQKMAN